MGIAECYFLLLAPSFNQAFLLLLKGTIQGQNKLVETKTIKVHCCSSVFRMARRQNDRRTGCWYILVTGLMWLKRSNRSMSGRGLGSRKKVRSGWLTIACHRKDCTCSPIANWKSPLSSIRSHSEGRVMPTGRDQSVNILCLFTTRRYYLLDKTGTDTQCSGQEQQVKEK